MDLILNIHTSTLAYTLCLGVNYNNNNINKKDTLDDIVLDKLSLNISLIKNLLRMLLW